MKSNVFKSSWTLLNWEVALLRVLTIWELKKKAVLTWFNLYIFLIVFLLLFKYNCLHFPNTPTPAVPTSHP